MLNQWGAALSPVIKERIKESFRGSSYWKFRKTLRLYRSSKDILDKVGKESITGSVNCQPSYFIDKLTFFCSRVACSYYALKSRLWPDWRSPHSGLWLQFSNQTPSVCKKSVNLTAGLTPVQDCGCASEAPAWSSEARWRWTPFQKFGWGLGWRLGLESAAKGDSSPPSGESQHVHMMFLMRVNVMVEILIWIYSSEMRALW